MTIYPDIRIVELHDGGIHFETYLRHGENGHYKLLKISETDYSKEITSEKREKLLLLFIRKVYFRIFSEFSNLDSWHPDYIFPKGISEKERLTIIYKD